MISFAVFKQGREKCVALTDMISNVKQRAALSRISDAVNLALSLDAPGIQQDGGKNSSIYMGVCGHCLGNIRGLCCATCRHIETVAREAFSDFKGNPYHVLTERDDILLTAAVIFDFMKVHHRWPTFDWTEDILKRIGSDKLRRVYEELDSTLNINSKGLKLHTILQNSMMSIGLNGVHVWSPTLIKNIFKDRLSAILSSDESPATPTPTENDINMLFSEEEMDISFLFDNNEPTIEMIEENKTCASIQQFNTLNEDNQYNHDKCCERVMVDYNTLKPRTTIFKKMQRTKQYRDFIKNAILLPEKKIFKDPVHCKFLHDFMQIEFEFKFDTSKYEPKKMISQLFYTDRFLNFIKSIVPKNIDSSAEAFRFVNRNLLIKKKSFFSSE